MDQSFLPNTGNANTQIFTCGSITSDGASQIWEKPRNVAMVLFILIGAGAGGTGGFSAAAGTARGGSGGGGSGGAARLLIPATFLPDHLYINIPRGGPGGAAATLGTVGQRANIGLIQGQFAAPYIVLLSGAADAQPGTVGTAAAPGTGGAASTVATNTSTHLTALGNWSALAGRAGSAGGAITGGAGAAVTWGTTGLPCSGGAGGGGSSTANVNGAGGAITGSGLLVTLAGGLAAGGNGNKGIHIMYSSAPLNIAFTGGSGGGANGAAAQVGGTGGIGGIGSGGGAGGSGVTGGAGGRGGDGMAVIISW